MFSLGGTAGCSGAEPNGLFQRTVRPSIRQGSAPWSEKDWTVSMVGVDTVSVYGAKRKKRGVWKDVTRRLQWGGR